jgi:RNA polymerase sigma-70 factor, ECF subfamily
MTSRTPATASPPTSTSWQLLALAQRGDPGALERLVLRYLPRLRRWARRLPTWVRSAVDSSDVVHDVIVHTLSRLDVFQPRSRRALASYLRTAVRHRIADEHRRAARWRTELIVDALRSNTPTPLQSAIDAETERRYRAALADLSRRDRELIVAHLELDYSHAQLGCMIGRSPHAARMALCRAIGRLAERMRV